MFLLFISLTMMIHSGVGNIECANVFGSLVDATRILSRSILDDVTLQMLCYSKYVNRKITLIGFVIASTMNFIMNMKLFTRSRYQLCIDSQLYLALKNILNKKFSQRNRTKASFWVKWRWRDFLLSSFECFPLSDVSSRSSARKLKGKSVSKSYLHPTTDRWCFVRIKNCNITS